MNNKLYRKDFSSEFDAIFKWNRIFLRMVGNWPMDIKQASIFESFIAGALIFILCVVLATEWADLILIWGQFDPMLDNLTPNFGMSLGLLKIFVIRWNIEIVKRCLDEVRKDWQVGHAKGVFQVMLRRAKIGRIFSIAGPGFAIATGTSYTLIPLIVQTTSGNATEIFPFLPLTSAQFYQAISTPAYQLTYLTQVIACHVSGIAYSATDCFFAALALHASAQAEILGKIIRESDPKNPMIGSLVESHLKLIRFVKSLEDIFGFIILAHLLVGSLAICSIGYKLVTSLDDIHLLETVKFIFYLASMLMQMFLYCYAGQCLIDENVRLAQAVYDCNWYEMSRSDAKAFLIVQSQAQKPLQVTALKFHVMCHECFANILRTSAAYLSVLRAVK